jgi:transcriptional regulator with XRE-family HTH domain
MIRGLRLKKKMSLRQLSRASGVSLATVVRLEKGQFTPRGSTLERIAKGLGVSVKTLNERRKPVKVDLEKEATEASRESKKVLTEWWNHPETVRLKDSMTGYDLDELALIYKQMQLKLRNQQTSGY